MTMHPSTTNDNTWTGKEPIRRSHRIRIARNLNIVHMIIMLYITWLYTCLVVNWTVWADFNHYHFKILPCAEIYLSSMGMLKLSSGNTQTKVVNKDFSLSDMESELCRIKEMRALQYYYRLCLLRRGQTKIQNAHLYLYNCISYFIFSVDCCCPKL